LSDIRGVFSEEERKELDEDLVKGFDGSTDSFKKFTNDKSLPGWLEMMDLKETKPGERNSRFWLLTYNIDEHRMT
jgi:hypothetical protein